MNILLTAILSGLYNFLTKILIPYIGRRLADETTLDYLWAKFQSKIETKIGEKDFPVNFHSPGEFKKYYGISEATPLYAIFSKCESITEVVVKDKIIASVVLKKNIYNIHDSLQESIASPYVEDEVELTVYVMCHSTVSYQEFSKWVKTQFNNKQ